MFLDQLNRNWRSYWNIKARVGGLIRLENRLEAGADIETANQKGITPLLGACFSGLHTLVARLLMAGANVSAATNEGMTPLMIALARGHVGVLRTLTSWIDSHTSSSSSSSSPSKLPKRKHQRKH